MGCKCQPQCIPADPEFSLLCVCALQQALKVACSGKLPSESRTWVAAYTATVLSQLMQLQTHPHMLCTVIIHMFQHSAVTGTAQPKQSASIRSHAQTPAASGLHHTEHAEPSSSSTAAAETVAAGDLDSSHAERAGIMNLPREAQPLASLFQIASDALHKWQPETGSGRSGSNHETRIDQAAGAVKTTDGGTSSSRKRKHGKHEFREDEAAKKQRTSAVHPAIDGLQPALQVLRHCLPPNIVKKCLSSRLESVHLHLILWSDKKPDI